MGKRKPTPTTASYAPRATGMAESRRYVRHETHVPVEVQEDEYLIFATATTLSLGGAFVTWEEPPENNTLIKVTLVLDETRIPVTCRVVHDECDGMGLEFVDVTANTVKKLKQYFEAHNMDAARIDH